MRLAHCSDLHLLSLDGARALDYLNERWIGRMNLITSRCRHYHTAAFDDMVADLNAQGVDHIICTGDVTNLALPGEFRYARERFDRLTLGMTLLIRMMSWHNLSAVSIKCVEKITVFC